MKATLPFLCFALVSTAVTTAQDVSKQAPAKQAKQEVKAADVEKRLKLRTPKFRKVKLFDAKDLPKPAPAKTVTPGSPKPSARLLSDAEKQKLGADVVATVDGAPVTETEVMELAKYLAAAFGGSADTQITKAFQEIFSYRVIEAGLDKEQLAKIQKQIAKLHAQAQAADADFAAIAKEHSHCPSGKQAGGSLGMFGRETMVPSFARHAFSTPVGKVSPIFATRFGYHFLKVTGKQKGETPGADQVSASHVLLMFDQSDQKAGPLRMRLDSGTADIAVRDDEWRKKLPQGR